MVVVVELSPTLAAEQLLAGAGGRGGGGVVLVPAVGLCAANISCGRHTRADEYLPMLALKLECTSARMVKGARLLHEYLPMLPRNSYRYFVTGNQEIKHDLHQAHELGTACDASDKRGCRP